MKAFESHHLNGLQSALTFAVHCRLMKAFEMVTVMMSVNKNLRSFMGALIKEAQRARLTHFLQLKQVYMDKKLALPKTKQEAFPEPVYISLFEATFGVMKFHGGMYKLSNNKSMDKNVSFLLFLFLLLLC